MDELVRWLTACLDEEAQSASAASDGPWTAWRESRLRGLGDLQHVVMLPGQKPGVRASIATASWVDAEHIAAHDPARVLREINAKRDLLRFAEAIHDHHETFTTGVAARLEGTLRLFALAYKDRAGYRSEWAP